MRRRWATVTVVHRGRHRELQAQWGWRCESELEADPRVFWPFNRPDGSRRPGRAFWTLFRRVCYGVAALILAWEAVRPYQEHRTSR